MASPAVQAAAATPRTEAEVRAAKLNDLYAPVEPAPVHKLVDAKTGEEIVLPCRRTCWDGGEIVVRDFKASRFEGNPGYIYTTMNETFVPSVCGLKIVTGAA